MSECEVEYDKGPPELNVSHGNLLKQAGKQHDGLLDIKPFQVGVQVPLEAPVPDGKALEKFVAGELESLEKEVFQTVDDLARSLQKLQKEEQSGNKKAGDEAEKQVKAAEKYLKKLAGEFGGLVRKAVDQGCKAQKLPKNATRSASRTGFRGLELDDDAFESGGEGSEAVSYVGEVGKTLAALGKQIAKLTVQEKDTRRDLAAEIDNLYKQIEKERAGKTPFDIREYAIAHAKEARPVEAQATKYGELIEDLLEKLEAAADKWESLDKLKELDKEKDIAAAVDEYGDAIKNIRGVSQDWADAAKAAKKLLKDEYGRGESFTRLVAQLNAMKGATKSGKTMQEIGVGLEKAGK